MQILELTYADARLGWKLAPTAFSHLTLLVGVSGVGKTRILRSILSLKRIAEGAALPGVSWTLAFSATNGKQYVWSGEFEDNASAPDADVEDELEFLPDHSEESKAKPRILRESLDANGERIVERTSDGIRLHGQPTPKLPSHVSVLNTLREEDSISAAHESFRRVVYSDQTSSATSAGAVQWIEFSKLSKKFTTLSAIREATLPTHAKLALCYAHVPDQFHLVRERFVSIFPYVEDLKMEPFERTGMPSFFQEMPVLQLKERGVAKWIPQHNISSGMMRTFTHIGELFLSPEGTVVLIDEFENSLGVNCIDIVTEDLLNESRKIQFIVTSHHPYVINNIGVEYWKVVSRSGDQVVTRDAKDFHFDKSRHDAFIQLINLDEYKEGISVR